MGTKYDIEKFFGNNDFELWRIKMQVILVQQGCTKVLKGETHMSPTLSQKKEEQYDKQGKKCHNLVSW